MNDLTTSPNHLDDSAGRWMRDTWGVRVWVETGPGVSEATVCTSCPAEAHERCRNATGNNCPTHAGRLIHRQCVCGNPPRTKAARECEECAEETKRAKNTERAQRMRGVA